MLKLSCGEKAKFIKVLLLSGDPNKYSKLLFDKYLDTPLGEIPLDLTGYQGSDLLIKVWTNDYVINDYSVYIRNSNWKNESIDISGDFSYR